MKQKFLLLKNAEQNELIIKEYSELDPKQFSLICEQTYDIAEIKEVFTDQTRLFETIRNNNFYPISHVMERLTEELPKLFDSTEDESMELFFEDMEIINEYVPDEEDMDDDGDGVGIDSLLEVDDDNDMDLDSDDSIDTSIKDINIDKNVDDTDD